MNNNKKFLGMSVTVKTLSSKHEMFAFFQEKEEGIRFANYYRRQNRIYKVTVSHLQ